MLLTNLHKPKHDFMLKSYLLNLRWYSCKILINWLSVHLNFGLEFFQFVSLVNLNFANFIFNLYHQIVPTLTVVTKNEMSQITTKLNSAA